MRLLEASLKASCGQPHVGMFSHSSAHTQYQAEVPSGCFYHDDVWLSGYLYQAGVKRYVLFGLLVPNHFERHPNLSISSISDTQVLHQQPCVEHFNSFRP